MTEKTNTTVVKSHTRKKSDKRWQWSDEQKAALSEMRREQWRKIKAAMANNQSTDDEVK